MMWSTVLDNQSAQSKPLINYFSGDLYACFYYNARPVVETMVYTIEFEGNLMSSFLRVFNLDERTPHKTKDPIPAILDHRAPSPKRHELDQYPCLYIDATLLKWYGNIGFPMSIEILMRWNSWAHSNKRGTKRMRSSSHQSRQAVLDMDSIYFLTHIFKHLQVDPAWKHHGIFRRILLKPLAHRKTTLEALCSSLTRSTYTSFNVPTFDTKNFPTSIDFIRTLHIRCSSMWRCHINHRRSFDTLP